jgi:succinyl-CoA synthetase beta subunit
MRFYEFEAKALLGKYGIPLPKGSRVAKDGAEAEAIAAEIAGPVVLKAQVLTGGRMKAGGVLFADSPSEARKHAERILGLEINGHRPVGVLVEARAPVAQEYYLGVTWDGVRKLPVLILSDMGGIDVEEVAENHPEHIAKRHFSTLHPFSEFIAKETVSSLGISGGHLNRLTQIASRLVRLFSAHGLPVAEINPLARLEDGSFVCLDGHVDLEDEARDPQKDLLHELGVDPEE